MSEALSDTAFETLRETFQQGGTEKVFAALVDQLLADKNYHDLFRARLMQHRSQLGLPVLLTADEMDQETTDKLFEMQLKTCQEVGELFLAEGKLPEAWVYLQHTGQKQEMAKALEQNEPDEEQLDDWIAIAVQEGVAPRRGFEWVLSQFGTCNAVTMFEGSAARFTTQQRNDVAAQLVAHLHNELRESLAAEIAREEGESPQATSIGELVDDRDWLFENDNYHIDVSHLGAVVRFARFVTDKEALKLAAGLTEYGRHLSPQYQYETEEPFANNYEDHGRFFRAQLGEDVEEAVKFFHDKATSLDPDEIGHFPAEVYVCLLTRLGRQQEAFDAHRELIPPQAQLMGLAPSFMELAQLAEAYDGLREICQQQGDRVGFVAGLVQEKLSGS